MKGWVKFLGFQHFCERKIFYNCNIVKNLYSFAKNCVFIISNSILIALCNKYVPYCNVLFIFEIFIYVFIQIKFKKIGK